MRKRIMHVQSEMNILRVQDSIWPYNQITRSVMNYS